MCRDPRSAHDQVKARPTKLRPPDTVQLLAPCLRPAASTSDHVQILTCGILYDYALQNDTYAAVLFKFHLSRINQSGAIFRQVFSAAQVQGCTRYETIIGAMRYRPGDWLVER